MYLTVCPQWPRVMKAQWENECISLSVLFLAQVMIAQWENECISLSDLSVARVQFPAVAEYFKRFIPTDHNRSTYPEPVCQEMTLSPLNDPTQPVNSEEEGRNSWTDSD